MQSKLLIAGLVVLSLACAGLIAWICVLTGQPVWYAAAPVLLFLLVLGTLWAVSAISAKMGAARLEKGLMQQAEQQAKSARPDQKQHVVGLQRDFEKAVRELKGSRIGRAGRDALYLLPWYAIIGPSGAGKTTALRNSGLRFPNMRGSENVKVKGVGGTRNCDFWLTNDAVLLDTAGRWSTQEDDHHEWLGFLQLLRKHRTRKPLNGMIAAIGIGDVVNASPEEIDTLAERMRARLEEVVNELRVSIPIYVLFTKCDLLEGFIEMFGGLRTTEREQILGFTVPLSRSSSSAEQLFEDYFDELAENMRGAALARMGEERGGRARQRVYAFPEQFQAMRENLARFMTRLFENNVYRETVPLRGVYFSSGTQEGRPFNLLFEPSKSGEAPVVDQKGYFLRDLFMQVIFADSGIASTSQAELRRQRFVQMGLTGALGLVTLVAGIIPASVFMRSRHQIGTTADLVEAAERDALKASRKEPSFSSTARTLYSDLNRYERGGPSFLTTMGMYTGDRVVPSLRRYMATLLRRELVQPLVSAEAQAMTDFGLRFEAQPRAMPSPSEHDMYYSALKLHLLLTMQQMPQQYAKWVEERLSDRWRDGNVEGATPQLAATYVDWAQLYPELAFTQDVAMVRRVRAVLNRTSAAQQTLDAIVSHVASLGYDIDLPKLTGYNNSLSGTRKVRGAFTRRGYETVRDLFDTGAPEHVDELWVLGLAEAAGSGDRAARLAELESLYFKTYVQEWRAFIEAVHTREAHGSTAEALTLLRDLTGGVPTPLGRVFAGVATNVRLPPPKPDAKQEILDKAKQVAQEGATNIWTRNTRVPAPKIKNLKPERVIERFGAGDLAAAFDAFVSFGVATDTGEDRSAARGAVPFDSYREQLSYLRDALQVRLDNPSSEDKTLEGKITSAMSQVRRLIEDQPAGWRPVFEALLWPPGAGATTWSRRSRTA
jgi:type VI secretion system protein ImpL